MIGYVLIGIGAFFLLFGIIMCIPTNKDNSKTSVSAKVLECKEDRPDIENALEYAEKMDLKDTTFNYNVLCEYEYNGEIKQTVITTHKKIEMGEKIKINIPKEETDPSAPEVHAKKVTSTLIGGIIGIILSIVFIVIGILMLTGKI